MEGLTGETVARSGNCHIFPSNFQCIPGNISGLFFLALGANQ
jgi:hypothetical protein